MKYRGKTSLPIPRARQWWVKVLVVTSLAFGGGVLGRYLDHALYGLLEARRLAVAVIPLAETTMWLWGLSVAAAL